jgi:hypothetical protein
VKKYQGFCNLKSLYIQDLAVDFLSNLNGVIKYGWDKNSKETIIIIAHTQKTFLGFEIYT